MTALILSLLATGGLLGAAMLAISGKGPVRLLSTAAAVGIAALSQQFLIYAIAGLLLVLIGAKRLKSKNPVHRKMAPMNIIAGLLFIGLAFYLYW